ncbi:50S ribosome-binding GTPase [Aliarcobacter butzleri]|nr:50S ribosome-binding GTPase [Aliarcobacter butzleri]
MNTLTEFKKQQSKEIEILNNLSSFLEMGENLGVEFDKTIKEKLLKAINEAETEKLRVALIGGFSEGKTSIVAAWLEKLDDDMKISHQESSDAVAIYEVGNDIELIDTPGLFGFEEKFNSDLNAKEKYKDITKKYISEAHLVLYVMNPQNPLKDSHKEDLNWLFRTLNLLPRTVFILSKFDLIANPEIEQLYKNKYSSKKEDVIKRLKDLINLNDSEIENLSIVAVSANPKGKGIEYWLNEYEKFIKLSHIQSLHEATQQKIKSFGNKNLLVIETQKSIIQDILNKQLPISKKLNDSIEQEISKLKDICFIVEKNLNSLEPNIKDAKVYLRDFITNYFTDLILQVEGTGLETFNEFYEKEIGSEGININTKIQNVFEQQIGSINLEVKKIETNFNLEINSFNKVVRDYGKQGLNYLSKSNVINKDTVIATRNLIVSGAKTIGFDISKYLKFKPWGATKFASGTGVALSGLSLLIEAWDSYEKYQQEKKFKELIYGKNRDSQNREEEDFGIKEKFEIQRKEYIDLICSEDFIAKFFPNYLNLKNELNEMNRDISKMSETKELFRKWFEKGNEINRMAKEDQIINVEVYESSKVLN